MSPSYGINSTTTVLLLGCFWYSIPHEGWYAITKSDQTKLLNTTFLSFFLSFFLSELILFLIHPRFMTPLPQPLCFSRISNILDFLLTFLQLHSYFLNRHHLTHSLVWFLFPFHHTARWFSLSFNWTGCLKKQHLSSGHLKRWHRSHCCHKLFHFLMNNCCQPSF